MSSTTIEIPVPALLPHQQRVTQHPARFKLLRCGRRWGKDRLAFNVSWFGHGPDHCWAGIVDGWDVVWLAPTYPQARLIWQEELEPRFRGIAGVEVNETEHSVAIPGYGTLHLRSSESVDSIRGLGKRLIGVIVNEAAHQDLAYAWRQVIRPTLADNKGWALIMSTTNSGADGGKDDQGNARIPSYFNTLCEETQAKKRGPDWEEFYGTAEENPKIAAAEFQALVAEYPQDSTALHQEIYAKLLAPGAGLAFPEWRDDVHTVETFDIPSHWEYGAGFDWGYWQPSVLTVVAHGPESRSLVLSDHLWARKDGQELGKEIAAVCRKLPKRIEYIAADSSIWGEKASQGFPNLAEEIQTGIARNWKPNEFPPVLVAVPKGANSRITRANLLHRYLKFEKVGDEMVVHPRLRFLKASANCVGTIPKLAIDAAKPEDVDTTGNDHAYDALTYFLLSRPPLVDAPQQPEDSDVHPGFTPWGERVQSKTERRMKQAQLQERAKLVEAKDV